MTALKLVVVALIAVRAVNAILNIGKVRGIDSPATGAWNVLGWAALAALVVTG